MSERVKVVIISVFIWGGGQFVIGKHYVKGVILFVIQLSTVLIELFTGYWPEYFMGKIPEFSFRIHGGLFSKGIWGLLTLGEKAGVKNGDNSTVLLIEGVLVVLGLCILCIVYIWNIIDAFQIGKKLDIGIQVEKMSFKGIWSKYFPYVILTPIGIVFVLVVVMPIVFTFLTAFTNYNRSHLPPGNLVDWVGLENFKKILTVPIWSQTFFKILTWTIIWTLASTLGTYFIGFLQAVILNHKAAKCKKIFRTILILPWAIPQIVSLLVFRNLLNGQFSPINKMLLSLGIIKNNIPFLSDPTMAKVTVIFVSFWLLFPVFMIMISGILSNIDNSLYEAAAIDGANGFKAFRKITLPLVLKATMPNLIMSMVANFNGFGLIYFLTQGGPTNSNMQFAGDTDILISWIYKLTLNQQMYDIAAVMSILLFMLVGVISFWNFRRTTSFKEI